MIGVDERRVVLLVEDDPLVRAFVVAALVEAGVDPIQAANAYEAIAILDARPDVAGIISDIDMPGAMNGLSLAWEVAARWPSTPMTLMSGFAPPSGGMFPPSMTFLAKPVTLDDLTACIARMLGAQAPELLRRRTKSTEPEA